MSNSKDVTFRYDEDELKEIEKLADDYLEQRRREKAAEKKKKKKRKELKDKVGEHVGEDDLPIKLTIEKDGGSKITISHFWSKGRPTVNEDELAEQNEELLEAYREIQNSFAERTHYTQFQVTASG